MTNFNELFEQAQVLSDHRSRVFNELIEKVVNEILPKFCETIQKLDIDRVYFKTSAPVNTFQEIQHDEDSAFYCICINADKTFNDAKLNFYEGCYYIPEGWKDQIFVNDFNHFTRTGIVEFTKLLNSRLEDIIRKYTVKVNEANELLK